MRSWLLKFLITIATICLVLFITHRFIQDQSANQSIEEQKDDNTKAWLTIHRHKREYGRSDKWLKELWLLVDVTKIDLSFCSIKDNDFINMSKFTELETLILCVNKINGSGLKHLKSKKLRVLNLESTDFNDEEAHNLELFPKLEELWLSSTQISDIGLSHIEESNNLKKLALAWNNITDNGLVHFEKLDNLKFLHLCKTKISDGGLVHLKNLKKLEYLNIENTNVTKKGVSILQAYLPNCKVVF